MRFDVVRTVFRKELREMLRDRRSLAVMFGLPLVLYPLLAIGISSLGQSRHKELTEKPAQVVVPNAGAAPHLFGLMKEKDSGIELVLPQPPDTPEAALNEGRVDAIVVVPPDVEADALAGKDPEITVRVNRSRSTAQFAERKLNKVFEKYERWVVSRRLERYGAPASVLEPLKRTTEDVASDTQRFGRVLSQMLPLLLLMTGMLGAFFPALNATTTERELGTLETLLVTPAGRTELLLAKAALVLACALLTAGLNMLSMSLVLLQSISQALAAGGGSSGGLSGGLSISPADLALTYLAAVPALIFFSAIVLIVGLMARTFREANSYATPVMLLPLVSLGVGIAEPAVTPGLLVTPVANTTVIIREVLSGHVTAGQFILAFLSSCLYAGLMLSVAGRMFSSEQLVNPAWEPLSTKGLRRRGGAGPAGFRPRTRLPAIDEALALFAVSLVLLFHVGPWLGKGGLFSSLLGNELLLILAPALLFAWLGRWRWADTFAWRPAPAAALIGAALLGAGLAPWVQLIGQLQRYVWPGDSEAQRATMKLIADALMSHPVLTIVLIGVLAGVCEELFYRGPLQTALARKLPPAAAVGIAALLFAAIHMDLRGLPIRALLGALMGWIVWRGGSIFPAMLTHGVFDSVSVGLFAWALWTMGPEGVRKASEQPGLSFSRADVIALAAGAALLAAGLVLLHKSFPRRVLPETPGFPVSA